MIKKTHITLLLIFLSLQGFSQDSRLTKVTVIEFEGKIISETKADRIYEKYGDNVLNKIIRKNDTIFVKMSIISYNDVTELNNIINKEQIKELNLLLNKDFSKILPILKKSGIKETDLGKKLYVLNLWFTACKPCIKEMPQLNELKNKYANKDISFIAPALDNEERISSFLKKHSFNYILLPNTKEISSLLKISTYPTHLIFDENFILKDYVIGEHENIIEQLSHKIEKYY